MHMTVSVLSLRVRNGNWLMPERLFMCIRFRRVHMGEGDPEGWYTVLVSALSSQGNMSPAAIKP
jgi:hypothetical protein